MSAQTSLAHRLGIANRVHARGDIGYLNVEVSRRNLAQRREGLCDFVILAIEVLLQPLHALPRIGLEAFLLVGEQRDARAQQPQSQRFAQKERLRGREQRHFLPIYAFDANGTLQLLPHLTGEPRPPALLLPRSGWTIL